MFCIIIMTALKPRQLFCILHKKVVMEDPPTAEAVPPASKGRAYKGDVRIPKNSDRGVYFAFCTLHFAFKIVVFQMKSYPSYRCGIPQEAYSMLFRYLPRRLL